MENPTPFDLNEAIRRWQQNLSASAALCADDIEELASHLRASVQRWKAGGLSEEEAFLTATQRIGKPGALEREFAKVNPVVLWSDTVFVFWIVAGIFLWWCSYSLVAAILDFVQFRSVLRLMEDGTSLAQAYVGFTAAVPYYLKPGCAPMYAMAFVLAFFIVILLAGGGWKGSSKLIRLFENPFRTALVLALLGISSTIVEALQMGRGVHRLRQIWEVVFSQGYGRIFILEVVINIALISMLVFLALKALRRASPPESKSGNLAASALN